MSWHSVEWAPGLEIEASINFTGSATWTDVTDYLRAPMSFGFQRSRLLNVVPPGKGSWSLDNRTGRFSPANTSGPHYGSLLPGRHARLNARHNGGATYTLWYGLIEDWGDRYPQAKDGIATITTVQPTALLSQASTQELESAVGHGELAGQRVARVLTAAGWPLASSVDAGAVGVVGTTFGGNWLQHITAAVQADDGGFWCELDGTAVYEARYALALNSRSTTSQATFGPANIAYHDEPRLSSGLDLVVNQATRGQIDNTPVTVSDAASIASLRSAISDSDQTSLIVVDPSVAENNAWIAVQRGKTPVQHPTSITFQPIALGATGWAQVFARRYRDRVTVVVPTPWGSSLTVVCRISGVGHAVTAGQWQVTYHLEPVAPWELTTTLFRVGTSTVGGSHVIGW